MRHILGSSTPCFSCSAVRSFLFRNGLQDATAAGQSMTTYPGWRLLGRGMTQVSGEAGEGL